MEPITPFGLARDVELTLFGVMVGFALSIPASIWAGFIAARIIAFQQIRRDAIRTLEYLATEAFDDIFGSGPRPTSFVTRTAMRYDALAGDLLASGHPEAAAKLIDLKIEVYRALYGLAERAEEEVTKMKWAHASPEESMRYTTLAAQGIGNYYDACRQLGNEHGWRSRLRELPMSKRATFSIFGWSPIREHAATNPSGPEEVV